MTGYTWVGIEFSVTTPTFLWGFRTYQNSTSYNAIMALCWDITTDTLVAIQPFFQNAGLRPNNWLQNWIGKRIRLTTDQYALGVLSPSGYGRNVNALTSPVTRNGITLTNSWQSTNIYPPATSLVFNKNANSVDILVGLK